MRSLQLEHGHLMVTKTLMGKTSICVQQLACQTSLNCSPTVGASPEFYLKTPFLQDFSGILVRIAFCELLEEIGIVSFQQSCEDYAELIYRAVD